MDRLARLEEQIQKISSEIGELRDRVGRLEAAAPQPLFGLEIREPIGRRRTGVRGRDDGAAVFRCHGFAVGRTLMVLGGAYLLRALTDSGLFLPL